MGVGSGVLVIVGVLAGVDEAGTGKGVDVFMGGNGVAVGKTLCPPHAHRMIEKLIKRETVNNLVCFIPFLLFYMVGSLIG